MARLAVLNVMCAAILAALAIAGFLADVVSGPARFWITVLVAHIIFALWHIVRGNFRPAKFVEKNLTLVALAGTAHGMILAFAEVAKITEGDTMSVAAVAGGASLALWCTLSGLLGTWYLRLNLYQRNQEP